MNSMIKKIVAVMAAVVMAVTAAVSVSADYTNVDDYGFYYATNKNSRTAKINVGDTIPSSYTTFYACWLVSGLQPDYTYDIFLDIIFESSFDTNMVVLSPQQKLAYSTKSHIPTFENTYSTEWTQLSNVNGTIERVSDTHLKFHVFYNYNTFGLSLSTIALSLPIFSNNGGFHGIKVMSTGVGAYYDPGGDTYSQLIYEYGQDNPLPDVKDIKDQGAAMSSAEAAVRDKSSNLVSSVDSEWSVYQTDAKALATTLKPAATHINNLYATITAELPDEVKALFIAIPILLFIGWLIGRVRE